MAVSQNFRDPAESILAYDIDASIPLEFRSELQWSFGVPDVGESSPTEAPRDFALHMLLSLGYPCCEVSWRTVGRKIVF